MKYKLLYDGECSLCVRFADAARRFGDPEDLEVTPLQRHLLYDSSIPEEKLLEEIHLLGEQGEIFRGSQAIEKVLILVPRLAPMRWMIETGAGKKSLGLFYRVANRFRGRCKKCKRRRV